MFGVVGILATARNPCQNHYLKSRIVEQLHGIGFFRPDVAVAAMLVEPDGFLYKALVFQAQFTKQICTVGQFIPGCTDAPQHICFGQKVSQFIAHPPAGQNGCAQRVGFVHDPEG